MLVLTAAGGSLVAAGVFGPSGSSSTSSSGGSSDDGGAAPSSPAPSCPGCTDLATNTWYRTSGYTKGDITVSTPAPLADPVSGDREVALLMRLSKESVADDVGRLRSTSRVYEHEYSYSYEYPSKIAPVQNDFPITSPSPLETQTPERTHLHVKDILI